MKVFTESDRSAGDKPQPAVTVVFDSIDELAQAMGYRNAEEMWSVHHTISQACFAIFKKEKTVDTEVGFLAAVDQALDEFESGADLVPFTDEERTLNADAEADREEDEPIKGGK
jgi:hypothetical protein